MASLYELGWRQGTIVEAQLPLAVIVLDADSGLPKSHESPHGAWVIATQDCDLHHSDPDNEEPCVELRPVFTDDPPHNWGIRSAKLLLTEQDYVVSTAPGLLYRRLCSRRSSTGMQFGVTSTPSGVSRHRIARATVRPSGGSGRFDTSGEADCGHRRRTPTSGNGGAGPGRADGA